MRSARKRMTFEFRDDVGKDDDEMCFRAIPAGRLTGVPISINVTRLCAPVARTVSGSFESGQT